MNNSVVDCYINSYPFLLKTCVDWLLLWPFPSTLIPDILLFKVFFFSMFTKLYSMYSVLIINSGIALKRSVNVLAYLELEDTCRRPVKASSTNSFPSHWSHYFHNAHALRRKYHFCWVCCTHSSAHSGNSVCASLSGIMKLKERANEQRCTQMWRV